MLIKSQNGKLSTATNVTWNLFALSAIALLMTGCEGAGADQPETPVSASTSAGPSLVPVATVVGQTYVEQVELPGAAVHGFETTSLMAKIDGYVGEIATVNGDEVDIGTVVDKGTALATLDIPEVMDELSEKKALALHAQSSVQQAVAAIGQANADWNRSKAQVAEAKATKAAKDALVRQQETIFQRISGLVRNGSVGAENLDEARYSLEAAQAAALSAVAGIETSNALVLAARAKVESAMADKQAAEAQVQARDVQPERRLCGTGRRGNSRHRAGVSFGRRCDRRGLA